MLSFREKNEWVFRAGRGGKTILLNIKKNKTRERERDRSLEYVVFMIKHKSSAFGPLKSVKFLVHK